MHLNHEKQSSPDLIYILGTGRSGSTVLEIILSHGSDCVGAGELSWMLEEGWKDDFTCSCNERFSACNYWQSIIEELGMSSSELSRMLSLQHSIEWHTGFLKQLTGMISKADLEEYHLFNKKLVNAIQKATKKRTVIDSSKYAGRAYALQRGTNIYVFTILLTRSPEGLVVSFSKPNKGEQPPKSLFSIITYYVSITLMVRLAGLLSRQPVLHIRYEDLIRDPSMVMTKIEQWSGVSFSEARKMLGKGAPFSVGHMITGNRLRKEGTVTLKPSPERIQNVSFSQKLAITVMRCWQWLLRL